MKIDEIITALYNAEKLANPPNAWTRPKFTVYMDVDYHQECLEEIHREGRVHSLANEFFHNLGDSIRGCKVWRVLPDTKRKHHAPFHIKTTMVNR
jgi:hypothetical protein